MFSHDPIKAASEMLRVLKPGGRIAFAAWTPEGLAPDRFGPNHWDGPRGRSDRIYLNSHNVVRNNAQ
jgi:SAM-dependent methyltransferase